jgi:hypothetical protein
MSTNTPLSALDRTLNEIIDRTTAEIAAAVRRSIAEEVSDLVAAAGRRPAAVDKKKGRAARPAAGRRMLPCPFPGCASPTTGPRFSWFCAEHRQLPREERDRIVAEQRARIVAEQRARPAPAAAADAAGEATT